MAQKLVGDNHSLVSNSLFHLSRVSLERDRPEEAEPMLRKAFDIRSEIYGETNENTIGLGMWLGIALTALARYDEAEPLLLDSYTFYKNDQHQERTQQTLEALIDLYTAWGNPQRAAAFQDSLALLP